MQKFLTNLRRFFAAIGHFLAPILHFIAPYWLSFWHAVRHFWRRFLMTRWLILVLMLIFLGASTYLTFLAKTSDVEHLKANLQTSTTIYDYRQQRRVHCTHKRALMSAIAKFRHKFKMR